MGSYRHQEAEAAMQTTGSLPGLEGKLNIGRMSQMFPNKLMETRVLVVLDGAFWLTLSLVLEEEEVA